MTQSFEEYQRDKREREWRDRVQKQKEQLGNAERVQRARDWKAIANEKVKAGNFPEARDYYREAIILVEDLVEARRRERIELLVPLYCNLAQVHLKLGEHASVEEVAGKALEIASVPRNEVSAPLRAKAHFRRACARRALGRLEEALEDLAHAQRLQPSSEEAAQEMAAVRALLQAQAEEARARMGGFLNRKTAPSQEEKLRAVEERRAERRARAEQRQQMQQAFRSLAEGEMLYGAREKEMEPVRQREQKQRSALELERTLLNIVDEAKGDGRTEDFEEFMKKKEQRSEEQHEELGQKKRVLEKQAKEEEWREDDAWREQRRQQRLLLERERQSGLRPSGPPQLWESREVQRWCEQSLRSRLLGISADGDGELPLELAAAVCGREDGSGCVLRALVTNVAKLQGDAAVIRLSPAKPPLHFFDYFLKLDWEVGVVRPQDEAYRTADKLIEAAAADDGKAPTTVMANCLLAGTLKIREFSSEEEPTDSLWPLLTKVKRRESAAAVPLLEASEELQRALASRVQRLLQEWAEEYRQHWP